MQEPQETRIRSLEWTIPWRRKWHPSISISIPSIRISIPVYSSINIPVSQYQYSCWENPWTEEPGRLYRPWGHKESDPTEHAHVHMCSICSVTDPHIHHKTFSLFELHHCLNTYPYFSNHAWKLDQGKYEANQA